MQGRSPDMPLHGDIGGCGARWASESTSWSRREARLSQWAAAILGRAEKRPFVMVSAEMGMRAESTGASGQTSVMSQARARHIEAIPPARGMVQATP